MTARSSSHPPPRHTSRTAQKTSSSTECYTYICKDGANITTGHKRKQTEHKHKQDALQPKYKQAEKFSFYNNM